MATRTLLKLKPNLNLPLRFLRNPTFALTGPVAPFTRPDSPSLSLFKASTFSFTGMITRQMGTARSPHGVSRVDEDDDDDDDDDDDFDDEDVDMDDVDLNDEFDDSDDEKDEEEEKPKGKKAYPKKW